MRFVALARRFVFLGGEVLSLSRARAPRRVTCQKNNNRTASLIVVVLKNIAGN